MKLRLLPLATFALLAAACARPDAAPTPRMPAYAPSSESAISSNEASPSSTAGASPGTTWETMSDNSPTPSRAMPSSPSSQSVSTSAAPSTGADPMGATGL